MTAMKLNVVNNKLIVRISRNGSENDKRIGIHIYVTLVIIICCETAISNVNIQHEIMHQITLLVQMCLFRTNLTAIS